MAIMVAVKHERGFAGRLIPADLELAIDVPADVIHEQALVDTQEFHPYSSWNERSAHHSLPGFVQIFLDALIVPSLQTNLPFSQ